MNKTDQQKNNTYIDYWTETGKSSIGLLISCIDYYYFRANTKM